jgi:outer membrane lipoprotein-sorting protein
VGFEEHRLDFLNVRTNQNIPDARFDYDSPPSANVYRGFLFESED